MTPRESTIALVPAAGRGTRLGIDGPKVLAPISDDKTIWDVLYAALHPRVDRIHVVLAPSAQPLFESQLEQTGRCARVSTSVQTRPIGMGDAIFSSHAAWSHYQRMLVIWGDQVLVSDQTLREVIAVQARSGASSFTLPVVQPKAPYVEYCFDGSGRLERVLQSREGEACREGGYADIGLFVLGTESLKECWEQYAVQAARGSATGELNFLPFLPYLSTRCGWRVQRVEVDDVDEARGVNTPEDLAYCRRRLAASGRL
ncbi:MAG: NTP transferase domain-containing protein [Myxococcota bacterium]